MNHILKEEALEFGHLHKDSYRQYDIVIKVFRILVADLCQQFNGGHPGGAIGMAAIGLALWRFVMRYAPHTPDYFNRDRFVLSNGHTCIFQYIWLHLTGYKAMTFEQLKSYHSDRADALCPGHPEIEHEGIEVTTGPLGQGVANAVGMAAAARHLGATFNRPGFNIVSCHIWCMVGDACLQEGVALEAISLAGHWRLNNLTIIYDNNQVTCDGAVDLVNTENIDAKMQACGWEVIDVMDGCFDIASIVDALAHSRTSEKPTFVNVRTIIGLGSAVAGDAVAHGAAFGEKDVANMKRAYGFDTEQHFFISEEVRDLLADIPARGERWAREWQNLHQEYSKEYPELAAELDSRISGQLSSNWKSLIPSSFPSGPTATRVSSGLVYNPIAAATPTFLTGTADLTPSVSMIYPDHTPFLDPTRPPSTGPPGNYGGRYTHYGVREHAMAAVANGLAAFHPHAIIPITSSFFMFYLYAAPAVRMGALMQLQVIHVATHDSIGMGEDGPTHQPLELAALYRAMPNLLYIRPADSEETAGAWQIAIEAKETPSIISTSRHKVPQFAPKTSRNSIARGAYVLEEVEEVPDLTIIGVGAELCLAIDVAKELREINQIKTRVVSFPCQRLFEKQDIAYKRQVLRRHEGVPAVVIEPYIANGWERYADAACSMSTDRFGQSLPGQKAYEYFGFEVQVILGKILGFVEKFKRDEVMRGEFMEL